MRNRETDQLQNFKERKWTMARLCEDRAKAGGTESGASMNTLQTAGHQEDTASSLAQADQMVYTKWSILTAQMSKQTLKEMTILTVRCVVHI